MLMVLSHCTFVGWASVAGFVCGWRAIEKGAKNGAIAASNTCRLGSIYSVAIDEAGNCFGSWCAGDDDVLMYYRKSNLNLKIGFIYGCTQ